MPTSIEQQKAEYPLPVYNYKVVIDSGAGAPEIVSFAEVSQLEAGFEAESFRSSPATERLTGPQTTTIPIQETVARVVLRKGIARGSSISNLYAWFNSRQSHIIQKKDVTIHLMDEEGNTVITWTITNAFPVRLTAPAFNASSKDIAIESIELRGDGLLMEEIT